MKIVRCSNFDDETFNESFVASEIENKLYAEAMCDALIAKFCPTGQESAYFRVVENDYKPHEWEP